MPETSDHASAASTEPTRLDPSQDSHLGNLYRAAVGPIGADYYLPILTRFEAYGRAGPSWNWAACAITLNWMLFRGLWMPALLYLTTLAAAALALATGMALAEPPLAESVQWSLWAALLTMALLVPGFFGNAWLLRVYRKRLDKALAVTASLKDACMLLARHSSSRPRLLAIALGNLALASLVAVWSWPSDLDRPTLPRASGDIASVATPATAVRPQTGASADASASASATAPKSAPLPAGLASGAATTDARQTPASAPAVEEPSKQPAPSGGYMINVGLFAEQDNALRAHARLEAAGLPAISASVQTRNGQRTRVRAGPFATRAQADDAAVRIRALQLEAVVIRP